MTFFKAKVLRGSMWVMMSFDSTLQRIRSVFANSVIELFVRCRAFISALLFLTSDC